MPIPYYNSSLDSGSGITQEELNATLADKEDILTFNNNIFTPYFNGKIEREGDTITYFSPDFSQYLTTAAASTTYQPIQPSKVHLSAYKPANTDGLTNFQFSDVVEYTTQLESNAGSFNTTTGVFTAPRNGLYRIEGNIGINDPVSNPYLITVESYIQRKVGAGSFAIEATSYFDNEIGNFNTIVQGLTVKPSCILNLNVGDQIKLSVQCRVANNTWSIVSNLGSFPRATTLTIYTID